MTEIAFWMTNPHVAYFEIARDVGFTSAVFDVEHGSFGLADLDVSIGLCRGLGIKVYAKVLGPSVEAVQQALDFGADGVIIPHVGGIEEARRVCAAAKYPPLGLRSLSGGRPAGYKRSGDGYAAEQNARIRCYPMIETAEAFADVEKIAALPTVDGLFAGPTDLSYTRGRGAYRFGPEDQSDLKAIAAAARKAGKTWIFPAWTPPERVLAREHGAGMIVVASQFSVIRGGLAAARDALKAEGLVT
jgi:4-hydroxy-2-oxoheptanedioate aldolase